MPWSSRLFGLRHVGRKLLGPVCVWLVVMLPVLAINTAVRIAGGDPHPLSLRRLKNRGRALVSLARHAPLHFFSGCRKTNSVLIRAAARRHRIPEAFVRRVVWTESRGRRHQISRAGAMGVMQLMPATAKELGVDDPFDAQANIDAGTRYLARLWKTYDADPRRVAAAYNAGPGRVPRSGPFRVPRETQAYVRRVAGPRRPAKSDPTGDP